MGLVALRSGHGSRIFRRLMGVMCNLIWRGAAPRVVWQANFGNPAPVIARDRH